jgi:hypothetical protein
MPDSNVLCAVIRSGNFDNAYLADFANGMWREVGLARNWEILPVTQGLDFVTLTDVTHWRYFNDDSAEYVLYEDF